MIRLFLCLVAALLLTGVSPAAPAAAEDLPASTVVTRDNLDTLKNKTFQGYRVGDLLLDEIEWQIREHGLTVKLTPTKPYPPDPFFEAATEKYAGDVKFDPETGMISGWKAGVPFPNLDALNDPHGGIKVIWNQLRGRRKGDIIDQPRFAFALIDSARGVERIQEWRYVRYGMKGLYRPGTSPVLGDGRVYEKELNIAILPQDIKGVGTFTIRYDTGQVNDSWAYVRDVRRTRRLAGSAWMEPIGSTDILGDDFGGFNAYPTWYKGFEILGRGHRLVVANSEPPAWNPDGASPEEQLPRLGIDRPPHWNLQDSWEPREVYLVKAIAPDDHPLGYKIVVVDAKEWQAYGNFGYDKGGNHQKTHLVGYRVWITVDDPRGRALYEPWALNVDFRRKHATMYAGNDEVFVNAPIREEDVSLSVLEAAGR